MGLDGALRVLGQVDVVHRGGVEVDGVEAVGRPVEDLRKQKKVLYFIFFTSSL